MGEGCRVDDGWCWEHSSTACPAAVANERATSAWLTRVAATHRGEPDDDAFPMRTETWGLFTHGPRWFRVKGYGLRYVDHRKHPPLFSERYGYRRGWHIGPHCFMWIKPWPSGPSQETRGKAGATDGR